MVMLDDRSNLQPQKSPENETNVSPHSIGGERLR